MATPVKADDATTPELTSEQLAEMFKALPTEFQQAINGVNESIAEHNRNVDAIKSAEAKDPKLIKAELFEQNPSGNKKIARLYAEYLKLIEAAEKLKDDAYAVIEADGLMPKDLSEDEITKLKSSVTDSTKELRESAGALLKFEEMMPMFKGKIAPHIAEIKTRRGAAKASGNTTSGEGPKRIRFKRITVNDVTQDDKGNTVFGKTADGTEKFTFTFASQYLRKQHKSIDWSSKDLTDAYLEGVDENNLPDEREFVMTHTFKDANGNDQTVNYNVKAYR